MTFNGHSTKQGFTEDPPENWHSPSESNGARWFWRPSRLPWNIGLRLDSTNHFGNRNLFVRNNVDGLGRLVNHLQMKNCNKCGELLPLESFNKKPHTKDKRATICKKCTSIYSKKRLELLSLDPEWVSKKREVCRLSARKVRAIKGLPSSHRLNVAKTIQEGRTRNPERHHARLAVKNALRSRLIFREPCSVCGSQKSQAHHEDYSQPLEVKWFCAQHHADIHVEKRNKAIFVDHVRQ